MNLPVMNELAEIAEVKKERLLWEVVSLMFESLSLIASVIGIVSAICTIILNVFDLDIVVVK